MEAFRHGEVLVPELAKSNQWVECIGNCESFAGSGGTPHYFCANRIADLNAECLALNCRHSITHTTLVRVLMKRLCQMRGDECREYNY